MDEDTARAAPDRHCQTQKTALDDSGYKPNCRRHACHYSLRLTQPPLQRTSGLEEVVLARTARM
jgi:hypothetical protein